MRPNVRIPTAIGVAMLGCFLAGCPVADAGREQTVTDVDGNGAESVTLDASGSRDAVGTITSYIWSEGAMPIQDGVAPEITLGVGTHMITLTVTDNNGATDTDDVTITVNPRLNQSTVANAGPDQSVTDTDGNGSETVVLNATGSSDPDGSIVNYAWSEGGTPIAEGVMPQVVLAVGTHKIKLTVTDDKAATSSDTLSVSVTAAAVYRLHGINFSPYLEGQDPNTQAQITEEQIRTRMATFVPYVDWVRSFGCTHGLQRIGPVAHELKRKVAVGSWLGRDLAANELEIQNLIDVAKAGQADMAIVGSEVLLRGDLTESELIGYIQRVKTAIPGVPVTSADIHSVILAHPALVSACDYVAVNYYPYWQGIKVDLAIGAIHGWHQQVIAMAGGKKAIVSETSWPSAGDAIGDALPSAGNAALYFLNFVSWARTTNTEFFYFEAFDEPWKAAYEGPQGAHWGVWDKNGLLKPGMSDVFEGQIVPDNWSGTSIPGGPGNPTIDLVYAPPIGSFENFKGQVRHVRPADYRIVVYIFVNGWWIKPTFASPRTSLNIDGSWVCDITTSDIDQLATRLVAYLIPATYNPPILSSDSSLPPELDENAVDKIFVDR